MTPESLARNNTESGHQKALFAWAAMACIRGFNTANDPESYTPGIPWKYTIQPIAALQWLHAIPNGGARDKVTAARLKAEGVKPGIPDIFWPCNNGRFSGLYIELKKLDKHTVSKEQELFAAYANGQGYLHAFCFGWRHAADVVESYYKGQV